MCSITGTQHSMAQELIVSRQFWNAVIFLYQVCLWVPKCKAPMANHHCLCTCFNAYVVVISVDFYFSIVFGYGSVASKFETKEK